MRNQPLFCQKLVYTKFMAGVKRKPIEEFASRQGMDIQAKRDIMDAMFRHQGGGVCRGEAMGAGCGDGGDAVFFHPAQATPATPYDPELMLWYPALTAKQQTIFDLCYAAAVQGQESVPLPPGSSYTDACMAVDALLLDCPELSWLSRYYAVRYYQQTPDVATQVTLRFNGDAGETAHLTAARALAEAAGAEEPWTRALAIHDALCETVTYQEGIRAHDAYGTLTEGKAVCEGYAGAYALACRLAGIRCGVITGTAVGRTAQQ